MNASRHNSGMTIAGRGSHRIRRTRENMRGFTITEMVVTVAIAGILVAIAAPSFTALTQSQQAKSAATDIVIAMTRARGEAVKRSANMTVTPNNSDWTNGWQMLDPNTSSVIEDHAAVTGVTISGPASVTFQSSGRVQGGSSPSFTISVSGNSSATRCVSIDVSGRTRSKAGACS